MKKRIALIILDGWGYREAKEHNAIASASTPFFDYLWKNFPHTLLEASGEHVGLLPGVIGNSEVGHMTIGAGRIIATDLVRIGKAISSTDYAKVDAFHKLFKHVKDHKSVLHVMGLLSPIGVHSHQEHLHEFLKLAKREGVQKIIIHAFTDGRDSPPQSGGEFLANLENLLEELGTGHIASISGRYYAMDRDKNWDRTEVVLAAVFVSQGENQKGKKPSEALLEKYESGIQDEHLEPLIFPDSSGKVYKVEKNDGIFFFNFRNDRTRQLCYKINEKAKEQNVLLTTMTEYAPDLESLVAFPRLKIEDTLAEAVARAGRSQVHIAETEKYAHVTYFFNGERKELHPKEEHILIESRKDVKTHNQAPEMMAKEIADAAIKSIDAGADLLVINFANADMVGHTADFAATKKAVETIDRELKRIVGTLEKQGGVAVITADHGNAEINVEQSTGSMHTAHTLSKVPALITLKGLELHSGSLADVAPTVLTLMDIPVPESMTGHKLF
ncbi:MAG: 2,3-bisphosphoglycerate-independent phosphoglycerate mutase [Candidatus Paceibacterota bacterium]|jgi:2,3-bisphosphoglycerate-independent phosphoglycerate mutase